MRTIEITVSPTGEATVRTNGYAGPGCLGASRAIERALGEPAGPSVRTAEYYAAETATQQQETAT